MASLTIRNLDETIKRKLRIVAAEHGRSMEAEARAILSREMESPRRKPAPVGGQRHKPSDKNRRTSVCSKVRGAWKGRKSTSEIMTLTRGED